MANPTERLGSKFAKQNRYANFGSCVNAMKVAGFRGINCELSFDYPLTAITGLNGAGKSTIGQLLVCAHKQPTDVAVKRRYVRDFFPASHLDPKPFADEAHVEYAYETGDTKTEQKLTVSRAKRDWSGYKRQPAKAAYYIGLAFYLPKVERKDQTIYGTKNFLLTTQQPVPEGTTWATRILGSHYDQVFLQDVVNAKWQASLGMASRFGMQYSENNMGFGEGRVIHTIQLLESCPEKALIVLEEPETGLHEAAQRELANYFVDVSLRRGHQIAFSTHSMAMVDVLPPEGRKMLQRDSGAVKVYDKLSALHMRHALSAGADGHLVICVEDEFAKLFLEEFLQMRDLALRSRVRVTPLGGADAVKAGLVQLKKTGVRAIAVLDGDQNEEQQDLVYRLPGDTEAPEKLVFLHSASKGELKSRYNFDLDHYLAGHPQTNHHDYAKAIEHQTRCRAITIQTDCIRAFLKAQPSDWGADLVEHIKGNA